MRLRYRTADVTAKAGEHYVAKAGNLRFEPGETLKTVSVTVLDDAHDEGEETVTLTLSNASGVRLTDGEAIGMIENTDPLLRGLMARFGRAVAVQVVAHVEERLQASRWRSGRVSRSACGTTAGKSICTLYQWVTLWRVVSQIISPAKTSRSLRRMETVLLSKILRSLRCVLRGNDDQSSMGSRYSLMVMGAVSTAFSASLTATCGCVRQVVHLQIHG